MRPLSSDLLGVYIDNPFPNAPNGSLWSLPAEIRMYILVLFFGFYPKLIIKRMINIPDYSYGIYIFSFPTQQTLVSMLKIYDPYILFILSLCFTLFIAVFSWHCIEKPSLKLKGKTKNYFLFFKKIKPEYNK